MIQSNTSKFFDTMVPSLHFRLGVQLCVFAANYETLIV